MKACLGGNGVLLAAALVLASCATVSDPKGNQVLPRRAPGMTLHVSPDGADTNDGSAGAPFATLEAARDRLRALRTANALPDTGAEVVVHGGVYPVSQTFVLAAEDSGTADAPVVFRAAKGEAPVFSGGLRLSGFRPLEDAERLALLPEEARGKAVFLDLKPLGVAPMPPLVLGGMASGNGFTTHPVPELFFNGEPMTMARYPNTGMLAAGRPLVEDGHTIHGMKGSKTGRFLYEDPRHARWAAEPDGFLYGYWFFDWADSYERIAGVNPETREVTLAEPFHTYGYREGARYYAVNLFSELDMPGEWWLDRRNAVVYFIPPSDPAGAEVLLSLFPGPLAAMDQAAHVRFAGITWELGAGNAVRVAGGEDVVFAGCTVRRCGGDAFLVTGGRNHGVLSCDIYSMGRGGVSLHGGDRKTLEPCGHFVENCHIHHLSRIDHTYTPAVLAGGVGVRVSHNLMHHINSSALRVNGNDHLIELNEAHNVLLESDDQGGADMWGDPTFLGNVYRHNYWHHLGNWRRDAAAELGCGQAGIRLDDAISGVLIEGNIFHKASAGKTGFGGVQIHGGKDNLLLNNVFSDCEAAVSFSPWGEERWREFITPRIDSDAIDPALYAGRYPVYSGLWDNANRNHLKGNIALNCGKLTLRAPKNVVQEDTLTDPPASLFAAPDRGDFAMNTAAARRAGVPVIPFERIGLYKDAFRKELPSEEVAAARAEQ